MNRDEMKELCKWPEGYKKPNISRTSAQDLWEQASAKGDEYAKAYFMWRHWFERACLYTTWPHQDFAFEISEATEKILFQTAMKLGIIPEQDIPA